MYKEGFKVYVLRNGVPECHSTHVAVLGSEKEYPELQTMLKVHTAHSDIQMRMAR